jgi:hypothetical protein
MNFQARLLEKFVIPDNVYDTERKDNNNPIILISKTFDNFTDIPFLKLS